jgi:hypothetical protein
MRPIKCELVIDPNIAKALCLTVPPLLLAQASSNRIIGEPSGPYVTNLTVSTGKPVTVRGNGVRQNQSTAGVARMSDQRSAGRGGAAIEDVRH